MKVKKINLRPIGTFLKELMESGINAKTNRAAYHLLNAVNDELNKMRDDQIKIVENLGGKIPEGGGVPEIAPEKQSEFNKEIIDLLSETVDIKSSYDEQFGILKDFVLNYDGVIKADSTNGYNLLFDLLSKIEDKK